MQPKDISVALVGATRPPVTNSHGLATFQVDVPLFVWTELLTHRRFSRNASSARAMGTKRYTEMGYYLPDKWYTQGDGMQAGELIDNPVVIAECKKAYKLAMQDGEYGATQLATFWKGIEVSKEQRNRLIPPIKMVRGIVTGTEDAWKAFLKLRNNSTADTAMQKLARMIQEELSAAQWKRDLYHIPFNNDLDNIVSTVARIARVSYNRDTGKSDTDLFNSLAKGGHYSPFEHIAIWATNPDMSNYTCKRNDVYLVKDAPDWLKQEYFGWQSYRAVVEYSYRSE